MISIILLLFASQVHADIQVDNYFKMERMGLDRGVLVKLPWSDSTWPLYKGSIAYRFADNEFPQSSNWRDYYLFGLAHPASDLFKIVDVLEINKLSPAEKYDYWTANNARYVSLTAELWIKLENEFRQKGFVDPEIDLRAGRSIASVVYEEPIHEVSVIGPDEKTTLNFTSKDIKALLILLCSSTDTFKHSEVSGMLSPDEFHKTIVNKLGILKKALLDEHYRQIVGYSYARLDTRANYDSQNQSEVVVTTTLIYSDQEKSSYRYTLKLDVDGKIVGGNWFDHNHPQALSRPENCKNGLSYLEDPLEKLELSKDKKLSVAFTGLAKKFSENTLPIELLTNALVHWSSQ